MLRYLAHGNSELVNRPVPNVNRLNWEFLVVTKGACAPTFLNGDSPPYKKHSIWLLPPDSFHGWQASKRHGRSFRRCTFHFAYIPDEVQQLFQEKRYVVVPISKDEIAQIEALAQSLEPHFRHPDQYSHLLFEHALLTLCLPILKTLKGANQIPLNSLAEHRVERALAWYALNMERNPTVEEVASTVHISSAYLRRMTKQVRGQTPHQLFRKLQLKRAVDIMATSSDTLETISKRCGFTYVEDFTRVFKSEMGMTPDKWRRTLLRQD